MKRIRKIITRSADSLAVPLLFILMALVACSKSASNYSNAVGTTPSPERTLAPGVKPTYKVEVQNQQGVQIVLITFSGQLPAPEAVDKILRDEFEKVVKKSPKKDALGRAYLGEDDLTENQFSGNLFYKAAQKKILTEDEYNGTKSSATSTDAYFVLTEEEHTYPGVTPSKTWLALSLVFPKPPPQKEGYEALLAEIEKVRGRGLDVDAYVKAGDKNKKTSWYQVKDTDGAYTFANYDATTKQATRRGKILKQY